MATANLGKVALAMLGLLAFQNRDKIADFLKTKQGEGGAEGGGLLDQLSQGVSGTALGDILDRFRSAGSGKRSTPGGLGAQRPDQQGRRDQRHRRRDA